MIKKIYLLLFLLAYPLKTQEPPKNIIVIDENINTDETTDSNNFDENNNIDNSLSEEIPSIEYTEDDNNIVIDDIPNDFNEWYGVLSSDEGGLGWSMWGSTPYDYSLNLLRTTYFDTNSITLFNLTNKFLLSRAKKPTNKNIIQKTNLEEDQLVFFREKIKIMSNLGATDEISKLTDALPLEFKSKDFMETLISLRDNETDISFLCNNVLKKNFDPVIDIEKRKKLIACNIALKKFDEASLAIDLLENDSQKSIDYIEFTRPLLDSNNIKSNNDFNNSKIEGLNKKIISLADYQVAQKVFSENEKALDKIIFDMKLYDKSVQIEALERLVNIGVYSATSLKNEYMSYYNYIIDTNGIENQDDIAQGNSAFIRAKLFFLINNTSSEIERAKYLNLLWSKADDKEIQMAIFNITSEVILTIIPQQELSWFIYPATKALIISNELTAAKKWLFYMSDDLYNRAALDINFCKFLIILYIKDPSLMDLNEKIPETDYLLNRLSNSPETNDSDMFKILVTLRSLEHKFNKSFFEKYYGSENIKELSNKKVQLNNLYFNLEQAVNYSNLAETVLLSLNLLNSRVEGNNDYYSLYKPLNALYKIGLKKIARDYATELNLDFLN